IFRGGSCEHWITLLERHDIPACRVNRLEEILAHPQIAANGLVAEHEDPVRGRLRTLGPPIKMSATPTAFVAPAPRLGEHTDDVLREAGLSPAEIAELRAARVILHRRVRVASRSWGCCTAIGSS